MARPSRTAYPAHLPIPTHHARAQARRARPRGRPALLMALMALLAYAYVIPRGRLTNADSHLALTRAIVDGHTLQIDQYAAGLCPAAPRPATRLLRSHSLLRRALSGHAPGGGRAGRPVRRPAVALPCSPGRSPARRPPRPGLRLRRHGLGLLHAAFQPHGGGAGLFGAVMLLYLVAVGHRPVVWWRCAGAGAPAASPSSASIPPLSARGS